MKTAWLALAGSLVLAGSQAMAEEPRHNAAAAATEQAAAPDFTALGDTFAKMFPTAEPLSPEAEARLPAAQEVTDFLFPPGIFAKVIDESLGDMFHNLGSVMAPTPVDTVAKLTGLSAEDLADLDTAQLEQAQTVLDPSARQRASVEMDGLTSWMKSFMDKAEPLYRDGYAKAFASRFTVQQLADLKTFFNTPSGSFFASQFVMIGTDPQVKGKLQEVMPLVMADMPAMIDNAKSAAAALPPERYFNALDPAEKARLAKLIGRSVEELDASSTAAQAAADATADEIDEDAWGDDGDDTSADEAIDAAADAAIDEASPID